MSAAVSYACLFHEGRRAPRRKQKRNWFSKCFGYCFYKRLHIFCIAFQIEVFEFRIVRIFNCAVVADGEIAAVHVNTADCIANAVFSIVSVYYFLLIFFAHAGQRIACRFRQCCSKSFNFLIRFVRVQVNDLHFLIFHIRNQRCLIVSCFDAIFPKDGCM